jgi:hypothetical protein
LLIDQISSKLSADTDLIVYKDNLNTTIQSKMLNCAVPNFIIKLSNDFNYVAYHNGSTCNISTLSANKITLCSKWSTLEEII